MVVVEEVNTESDDRLPSLVDALDNRVSAKVIRQIATDHPEQLMQRDGRGQLPVHYALSRPNDYSLETIRVLVELCPESLRETDNDGDLPLHHAVFNHGQCVNGIEFLVQSYPESIREKTGSGQTPLHLASRGSTSIETFRFLVKHYPEAVREKDKEGCIPLHHFLYFMDSSLSMDLLPIRLFVEEYPECVRESDNDGRLPIHYAARKDGVSLEVIRFLVDEYPEGIREKDHKGLFPLHHAATLRSDSRVESRTSALDIVQFLFNQFPECVVIKDEDGYLPLHHATASYDASLDVIQFLVKQYPQGIRQKTLDHGFLPLHLAARNISDSFFPMEVSRYLVAQFPESVKEKDNDGYLPLHRAVTNDYPSLKVVQFLAEQYPQGIREKTHDHAYLPLHLALKAQGFCARDSMTCYLLEQFPESVRVKDSNGYLPLHHASYLDMVRYLVEKFPQGVQELTLDHGYLPLHLAAKGRSHDVARFLVEQFPESVVVMDHDGYLPLHRAAAGSSVCWDLIHFLVEKYPYGLREKTLGHGSLPLHLVVSGKDVHLVGFMLECYCESQRDMIKLYPDAVKVKDNDGYLPLHRAVANTPSRPILGLVRILVELFPQGLRERTRDHNRFLPLHIALSVQNAISIDVSRYLIEQYPEALQQTISTNDDDHDECLLPVFMAATNATWNRFEHLELIYVCVLHYPNFLF